MVPTRTPTPVTAPATRRTRRRSQRRLHQKVWVQIGRHKVAGIVTAIDLPGLPYGIKVQFRDGPLGPGEPDNCYATYDEVKPRR